MDSIYTLLLKYSRKLDGACYSTSLVEKLASNGNLTTRASISEVLRTKVIPEEVRSSSSLSVQWVFCSLSSVLGMRKSGSGCDPVVTWG